MRRWTPWCALSTLAALGQSARAATPSNTSMMVRVDGVDRPYRVHVPDGARGPMPLVVAFHAAGSTAARQERASGLSTLADREGFVVVYPEGRGHHWSADDADEAYVRAVVAAVEQRVSIDPQRVYAAGVSNGATMAERAACSMGDVFAAIATVAGVYRPGAACTSVRPMPVLAIHGARDRLAPFANAEAWTSSIVAQQGCDAEPATLDGVGVSTRAWRGCAGGAEVVLDVLWSVGHGWPGDPTDRAMRAAPLDASAAIWAFFAGHSQRVE